MMASLSDWKICTEGRNRKAGIFIMLTRKSSKLSYVTIF